MKEDDRPLNFRAAAALKAVFSFGASHPLPGSKRLTSMSVWMLIFLALFGTRFNISAAPLLITTSGAFSSTTPSTAWTSAGGNWTLSFTLDSAPTVSSTLPGAGFDVSVTNFSYILDGSAVAVGPVDVLFYNNANSGLFSIGLLGEQAGPFQNNGFQFEGPQIYSGTESKPTLLSGSFTALTNTLLVQGNSYDLGGLTVSAVPAAVTPEPPTFYPMALIGSMVVIAGRLVRKGKRSMA